jgi:glycosyltransferase involved in cell wall biosynthesis
MLSPGALGLGIIDSFVCGIPTITSDCGIHGPEIAYLRPGENGILTHDDVDNFALAVSSLLADPDTLKHLCRACLTSAAEYSLANMASRFVDGIVQALAAPRYG